MPGIIDLNIAKGHITRFDIDKKIKDSRDGKKTLNEDLVSGIKYKRIPEGKVIFGLKKGYYADLLKVGDWVIVDVNSERLYFEIKKVNQRTLMVEKEELDGKRVIRYIAKIKNNIIGAIII